MYGVEDDVRGESGFHPLVGRNLSQANRGGKSKMVTIPTQ